jgi:heme exporter protein A
MPIDGPRAEPLLAVRAVSKFFGEHVALRLVTLELKPGDAVLLHGPNGAGKTTLLRILAGLARPTEGEVWLAGETVSRRRGSSKSRVGFLSHATLLYGELTGRENLRYVARLFGLRQREERISAALELFAVAHRADEPVRTLSRGLQQRVALARAVLHDPDLLLLDEPFTGLDSGSVANLQHMLASWVARGKTLVFSTHDFELGRAIARRMVSLRGGTVCYDGPLVAAPPELLPPPVRRSEAAPLH